MLCKPNCVTRRPPVTTSECLVDEKPGGIYQLGFAICGIAGSPLEDADWFTDEAKIKEAICAGHLFFTGTVLGEKPKGSVTKKRISSCSPEKIVAGTKTINFQDYNSYDSVVLEDDANYEAPQEYLFWDFIEEFQAYLNMFAISCDGRVFFVSSGDWVLEIDEVIEQTKDDSSFFDGSITIQKKGILFGYTNTLLPEVLGSFVPEEDCEPGDYILQ